MHLRSSVTEPPGGTRPHTATSRRSRNGRVQPRVTIAFLSLLFFACLATGCGPPPPKLVPVRGRVVFEGQPLTAGSVTFHPAANATYTADRPSSLLQLDGGFTMKTYPFGAGVAPGRYTVTLAPELANRIGHPEMADPDRSPWQVDVDNSGTAGLVLEVP